MSNFKLLKPLKNLLVSFETFENLLNTYSNLLENLLQKHWKPLDNNSNAVVNLKAFARGSRIGPQKPNIPGETKTFSKTIWVLIEDKHTFSKHHFADWTKSHILSGHASIRQRFQPSQASLMVDKVVLSGHKDTILLTSKLLLRSNRKISYFFEESLSKTATD